MILTHTGHLWLCIWKCMCPRNSVAIGLENRKSFWWEGLLNLFLKGTAAYILAAYKCCVCGCVAWLQYSGVLPGKIVIKTTLWIVFHAKPGMAALEMMNSQFQTCIRWTLRGSDCLLFWFLVSLEENGATSQGILLTLLPPVKVKAFFCECSRPQDCCLVLLVFKCLCHGRLCCLSELCSLQFTRCSFLIRAVNCLSVYKRP